MTDPDDRRERAISAIPAQITHGAHLAAMIPQTIIPANYNRPLTHQLPQLGRPLNAQPVAGPSRAVEPVVGRVNIQSILDSIPQTEIPANLDRPFQSFVPPPTILIRGRGRGRGVLPPSTQDRVQRARLDELAQNLEQDRRQREENEQMRLETLRRELAEQQQHEVARREEAERL